MKLISWNVNGIRAAERNGFLNWLNKQDVDVVALQEIKATPEQAGILLRYPNGYKTFWNPAQKPGYSGVAVYCRQEPLNVHYGIGLPEIDSEGRVLVAEFPAFHLINAYFPNAQRDLKRIGYKLLFCEKIHRFCDDLRRRGKNIVLCGDVNIAHREIDLKNPKSNQNNSGFLPEERAWLDCFTESGYIDTFRHFIKEGGHYTWWSYRPGVRERNIGWRIDYFFTNPELKNRLRRAEIHDWVLGSDHCPVFLELDN